MKFCPPLGGYTSLPSAGGCEPPPKKMKFLNNFRVLELQISFYTQKKSPDQNTKKKNFRKFFLRFFFDFFRKIRIFPKNDPYHFVKTPHFKSAPTLFLLKIFKKSKKSQKWSPDLGVSIGQIFGVIGGHSGELEHPTFFFFLGKQGFSEFRSLYLAKYAF